MTELMLETELQSLRRQLEEAEETLRAIRNGEVDGLVVDSPEGNRVFTLQGADHPYRAMIQAMQQGAASLADDGTILYCNRSFAEMLQRPHEKVIGANVAEFLPAYERQAVVELLEIGHAQAVIGEFSLRLTGADMRPVLLALSPLPLPDAVAICMVVTDLTEQKKHQDLQEVNRRKDEFLAMLAHELRNPLAPILNAAAILHRVEYPDAKLAYAGEIIGRQALHLSRLVDDLLDVSRISLGKVKLRTERLNLNSIVERAVETSRPLIEARKHRFTMQLPPHGVTVEADPTRLAQIISNLLTNAAKYSEEGGTIELTVTLVADEVELRVRDTGIGMPPELLPCVFDLFTQGDRSLARSEGGLGIGLTLVKRLVQLHGGSVEAFSAGLGTGSEFLVRLPAFADQIDVEPEPSVELARPMLLGRRILVVEDNVDGANSLALLLGMLGHDVSVVHTGTEAIPLALRILPEVVLLDIGLPGMSGYEVVRRLRQMPQHRNTLLVAMTGYGQEDDRRQSREAGFDDHLVKPVDLQTLRNLLDAPALPQAVP